MRYMQYEVTEYRDGNGEQFEAVQVSWSEVRRVLGGRDHQGTPEDDRALVAWLLSQGAPPWVRRAQGWTDANGWGLIGPREVDSED